jgi:RNA polymerase sigma factor (sigma-70 family)
MSNKKNICERQLISIVIDKRNEEDGFKVLYDMYADTLLEVVHHIIPEMMEAEDVCQECMIKIWTSIGSFNPDKGRLFTWMLKVARNHAIDKYRSKNYRRHKITDELESQIEVIDYKCSQNHNIDVIGLKKLAENLGPKLFDVVDMVYYKGYTHVEAAQILNLPLGTLKNRVRYALNELKKNF